MIILGCGRPLGDTLASLVAQKVKHLPAMRETWVRSLGQEHPLEKEIATHSSTLAWKIPWSEDFPGKSTGVGCYFLLQYSCLENPMVGGSW